jgi:hypothetical protein
MASFTLLWLVSLLTASNNFFSLCAGQEHCPVPLWERQFCCYVGNISWQRFCDNKHFVGPYNNLDRWDDSGALENFKNAKARFWANYHSQPSDIPFPDPDLYIDKVDQHCKQWFQVGRLAGRAMGPTSRLVAIRRRLGPTRFSNLVIFSFIFHQDFWVLRTVSCA